MFEASIWMMALGLTGIISAGVIVAAKVGEWIGDMFDRETKEEPLEQKISDVSGITDVIRGETTTIEERTRRAA